MRFASLISTKTDTTFFFIINILILIFFLAIVPIEYFSERNGSGGNVNGTKIKSINEENRV
jgi:hypothetical protein